MLEPQTIENGDFTSLQEFSHKLFSLGLKKIAFAGNLGAGKTTLIKYLLKHLGEETFDGSPTYSIIHNYNSRHEIYHIDAYRIDSEKEAFDLGLEELFESEAYFFIEWPEKIKSFLPDDIIWVYIRINPESESRTIEIQT